MGKQSWTVGVVMLYIILQGLTMIVQQSTTGDTRIWGYLNSVFQYNVSTSVISNISMVWAEAGAVLAMFVSFLEIILMYYPALFPGNYVWIWWCILLPIDVGMVMSVIAMIRGVHTS